MEHVETDIPCTEKEHLARNRANILQALRYTNGRISGEYGASRLAGIKPATLAFRRQALEIQTSI